MTRIFFAAFVFVLVLAVAGCGGPAQEYHRSVCKWEVVEFPQEGGQPLDTVWFEPNKEFGRGVSYADTYQDGQIDRRDERMGKRQTISSFDDDRDGRFDRKCVFSLDGPNSEKTIDWPVPTT